MAEGLLEWRLWCGKGHRKPWLAKHGGEKASKGEGVLGRERHSGACCGPSQVGGTCGLVPKLGVEVLVDRLRRGRAL